MVDISRFGEPESAKAKPDTSRFGKPDTSRFGKPAAKTAPEEPGFGEHLYGGAYGLASGLLGQGGDVEKFLTEPEPSTDPKLRGYETALPTSENVKAGFEKLGLPKPAPGTEPSVTLGEYVPVIAGGTSLIKSLGGYVGGKIAPLANRLLGKESAALEKEAESLGQKVKGQTATSVAERAAAETKAAEESAAKARELQSPKNVELQAQKDISGAKAAVSQKLIAEKVKTKKATEDALSKLSSKANTEEEVGGLIQPLGRSNVKNLQKTRQTESITNIKEPTFEKGRAREAKGEFIGTDPKSQPVLESAFSDLETQINRTTEPYRSQLKARLQSLKGTEVPLSEAELRVEKLRESSIPGYVAKTTKQEPMTLDQAEFMRRMMTDKDLSESTGFAALDIGRRTEIGKKISAAMKEFEPGVGEYLTKYQETSAPITKALAGRGGQLTEAERLAEQEVLFSADKSATAKYYLDGSQERAERLLDLVGGKPKELVDSIAGLVRGKMEKMTAKQAEEFTNQGLFKVFPELKASANQVLKSKQAEEKAASLLSKQGAVEATGATGRLGKALGTEATLQQKLAKSSEAAATTAEKARESATKFESFNTHLGTLSGEDSLSKSKQFLTDMAKEGRIPQDAYQKSLQEIQQAEQAYQKFKDADSLKKSLRRALTYKALATTVGGGTAYYFTH